MLTDLPGSVCAQLGIAIHRSKLCLAGRIHARGPVMAYAPLKFNRFHDVKSPGTVRLLSSVQSTMRPGPAELLVIGMTCISQGSYATASPDTD